MWIDCWRRSGRTRRAWGRRWLRKIWLVGVGGSWRRNRRGRYEGRIRIFVAGTWVAVKMGGLHRLSQKKWNLPARQYQHSQLQLTIGWRLLNIKVWSILYPLQRSHSSKIPQHNFLVAKVWSQVLKMSKLWKNCRFSYSNSSWCKRMSVVLGMRWVMAKKREGWLWEVRVLHLHLVVLWV